MDTLQARRYFESMGCSHFHMAREDPDKYAQYLMLGITSSQEQSWCRDCFNILAGEILSSTSLEWQPIVRAINLCEGLPNVGALQLLQRVVAGVGRSLDAKGSVIVAESIIGTATYHFNSGPIYLAVKLHQPGIARVLAAYAINLATRAKASSIEISRAEAAIKKCGAVQKHFGL